MLKKHEDIDSFATGYDNFGIGITVNAPIELNVRVNKKVNELFSSTKKLLGLISNLANVYI